MTTSTTQLTCYARLSVFGYLTGFAGLAVWGGARGSGRRWRGGGGHSISLVPLLRTNLRGLYAFDSPGMAVSFVMRFCLAL